MKGLTMAAAAALFAGAALAGEVAPQDIQFGEYGEIAQSLTGVPGDPANGAKIMVTRPKGNCIACHETTSLLDSPFHGEVGPTLDGVADRWNEAELRGLVANAKMTFEGTIMPAFYKTSGFTRPGNAFTGKAGQEPLTPLLTAQEVEDVVAYLMTLKEE